MGITYRSQKGSKLTSNEVDGNFQFLDDNKQDSIGYIPENSSNKDTDGTLAANSDTKYPSQKAVKTYVDANAGGVGKENVSNKATVLTTVNDTLYPTVKAVNYVNQGGAYTASIMSSLNKQTADINIVICGDSTGDQTGEWDDLLVTYLASLYPTHTVTKRFWNTGTLVYDAPSTVQTGTGTKSLNIYIGGASGAQVTYAYTNIVNMIPVTPDLVMLSYGHNNNNPSIYRSLYYQTTNEIRKRFPSSSIICIAQNPKGSAILNYQNGLDNVTVLSKLCETEGYGFINVMQAFIDYGDYNTDLLLDGTHPNAAGSQLWFDVVKRHFPVKNYSVPKGSTQQINEIMITEFIAVEGGCTFGINSVTAGLGGYAGWTMPDGVKSGIQSMAIILPTWWQTIAVTVYFQTPVNSTGKNLVFRFNQLIIDPSSASLATGLQAISASAQVVAGKAANTPNSVLVRSYPGNTWTPSSPRAPFQFSIYRDADSASDTHDGQVAVITGVKFERLT